MNKETENAIRHTFHIPEGELLAVWRMPGYRSCRLGNPEHGATNCPLGFDTGKWSPNSPPAWMRERLSEEVLAHCQRCQEEPQLTPEEAQISTKIVKVIIGNREAKEDES